LDRRPIVVAAIPAYAEAANIAKVIMKIKRHVTKVVVCDDGSPDGTAEIAKGLGATVVRHARNLGYGAALSTLFKEARKLNPDAVVTLDADGQHDPGYIPELIQPILREGVDLVIGSRFLSRDTKGKLPAYRQFGISMITKLANKVSYEKITDAQSGFRAYSSKALHAIQPTEKGMGASTQILILARQSNLRVKEIPVVTSYEGKTSKQSPITHWASVVISTVKFMPLRRQAIFYIIVWIPVLVVTLWLWVLAARIFTMTGIVLADITVLAIGLTVVSLILFSVSIMSRFLRGTTKKKSTEKR
jgi:glycosyltransferase involved in cell wall biosynthesis